MLSASEGKLDNSDRHVRKQTFTTEFIMFKHSHLQHSGITAWSPSKATQPEALPPTNHQSFPQPRSGSGHCGSLPCRGGIWPSGKESLNSHPPALHLAYFQIKQVLAFCQVATYRGKEAAFPKRLQNLSVSSIISSPLMPTQDCEVRSPLLCAINA